MRQIFLFLLMITTAALLAACAPVSGKLQAKRTVIAGKVENMPENATMLLVNFADPLIEERRVAQDLTISGGQFHFAHDYIFAQSLELQYGSTFAMVYLVPGDSLFVTIDGSKFQQTPKSAVTFSGRNAEINEQLFRWEYYAYRELPAPRIDPAAPAAEYRQSVQQHLRAMQDTIAAYARRNGMNSFAKQWAFTDYKFKLATFLLKCGNKWNAFTDSIFDFYNQQNFQSVYFQYCAGAALNAFLSENEALLNQLNQGNYSAALRTAEKALSQKAPKGIVRDYLFYGLAYKIINEKPEVYDSLPNWNRIFSQALFKRRLASLARKKSTDVQKFLALAGQTTPGVSYLDRETGRIASLQNIDVLPYLAERYKNKILYLDVWATWCGPCLEEMKHAPLLHDYFVGKEVVFVNLCLQSPVENWLQTVGKNDLHGENYYLDEKAAKRFMETHRVYGFPTYLLIDKNGKLHSPVARPSSLQSAIRQINSLGK